MKKLEEALKKLERRQKATQRGLREFVEVWERLALMLEEKIRDKFTFKNYTAIPFRIKQWEVLRDGRWILNEYDVIPAIINGEVVLYWPPGNCEIELYDGKYLEYVNFKDFIFSIEAFLDAIIRKLNTFEEEVEKLQKIKEIL